MEQSMSLSAMQPQLPSRSVAWVKYSWLQSSRCRITWKQWSGGVSFSPIHFWLLQLVATAISLNAGARLALASGLASGFSGSSGGPGLGRTPGGRKLAGKQEPSGIGTWPSGQVAQAPQESSTSMNAPTLPAAAIG